MNTLIAAADFYSKELLQRHAMDALEQAEEYFGKTIKTAWTTGTNKNLNNIIREYISVNNNRKRINSMYEDYNPSLEHKNNMFRQSISATQGALIIWDGHNKEILQILRVLKEINNPTYSVYQYLLQN